MTHGPWAQTVQNSRGNIKTQNKVKAEQEQNKKLQNQIRDMEKKIQDLGEEHKKEISKIKKVCISGDSNQEYIAQRLIWF